MASEQIAFQRIAVHMSHLAPAEVAAVAAAQPASDAVYASIKDRDCIIVAAARTPIGSYNGALSSLTAPELGAVAIKKVIQDSGFNPELVQEVYFGNVLSGGVGQAPARQAALFAGLPASTCCTTVNKVCSSGLKTIMLGCQSIALGLSDAVVCGGMESMSQAPYYLPRMRFGMKMGDGKVIDGMQQDGLFDVHFNGLMGHAGEKAAARHNISRADQDAFAKASYERALDAYTKGQMQWEIAPVAVPGPRGGHPTVVERDEELNNVKFEKFASMRPAFDPVNGTITAVNASKLSDGASAVLLVSGALAKSMKLPVIGRVLGYGDAELEPINFPEAPAKAIPVALQRAGLSLNDIDAFEVNEAFAVVPLALKSILGIDLAKTNQFGGSVALGHPLGSSGCRIIITCLNVLRSQGKRLGCVGVCNGGGGGSAMVVEYLGA